MEPVSYPEVTVGGQKYLVRFGMNSIYRLNSWGIKVESLPKAIADYQANGRNVEMIITLIAAALGKVVAGEWESSDLTPQKLADRLRDGEFQALSTAVAESLGGASPAETSAPTQPETMGQTSPPN
jgi:hypothetical protein